MSSSKAHVVSVKPLENKDARWINLVQIEYVQEDGKLRTWEAMRRPTRPKTSAVDAVQILAVRDAPTGEKEVLLEKQFRPPVDRVVIEFPAGLVDAGETAEECALRELREETGYIGEIDIVPNAGLRPIMFSSPASSASATYIVRVKVDMAKPENQNPTAQLEDGEFIECFWVPLGKLYSECQRLEAEGYAIDGKLGAFAEGFEMASA